MSSAISLVDPTKGLGVVTGSVRVDMAGVARRKWRMVNELVEVHLRADKNLDPDAAKALAEMFKTLYAHATKRPLE